MNASDVRAKVARIKEMSGDDESAHGAEDNLYAEVLAYYANGGNDPMLAKEALKTADISFARWRA